MDGDEKLRAQEEVDVFGRETVLGGLEVDAVQDDVEVIAVGFDLGMVQFAEGVFDRQLVKVEDVAEDFAFLRGRLVQIHPDQHAAPWFKPGGVHSIDLLSGPAFVLEDADQSPTLAASAACAAASRATGTRYGEQLT